MNIDDQLSRLFRAAQPAASLNLPAQPPFALQTRVLAAWRAAEPAGLWTMGLLVRGLVLAAVIMALSLWPALSSGTSNPSSDYLQLADSSLQLDNP